MKTIVASILILFASAQAATFTFNNYCSGSIEVTATGPGWGPNKACGLASRGSCQASFDGQLTFRNGYSGASTLAELNLNVGGTDWYDLSVVDGYNNPLQLINQCNGDTITCRQAKCPEAYDFPSDDSKVHSSPACGAYTINFCA